MIAMATRKPLTTKEFLQLLQRKMAENRRRDTKRIEEITARKAAAKPEEMD